MHQLGGRQANDAAVGPRQRRRPTRQVRSERGGGEREQGAAFQARGAGHGALLGQLGHTQDRRCGYAGRPAWPSHQVSSSRRQRHRSRHPFVQRLSGEEPRGVSAILPGACRQQARGPLADAKRGLPGDAPSREGLLDHAGSAASELCHDTYFGVNSFKFVNETGAVTVGRYQLLPDAGRHFLSKDESAKAATDYLEDEIRQRVAHGAVRFKVVLQLAAPGDKIDDPSVAWASTNKITTLGTLTVASVVPDSEATERSLMFLPALLPAGLEPADPMIQFRNKTYPVSYERRH